MFWDAKRGNQFCQERQGLKMYLESRWLISLWTQHCQEHNTLVAWMIKGWLNDSSSVKHYYVYYGIKFNITVILFYDLNVIELLLLPYYPELVPALCCVSVCSPDNGLACGPWKKSCLYRLARSSCTCVQHPNRKCLESKQWLTLLFYATYKHLNIPASSRLTIVKWHNV